MTKPTNLPEKIVWSELSLEQRASLLDWAKNECADLSEANLSEADLRGSNLSRANLRGADLSGAYLHEADLYGADLHGADLRDADLRKADLSEADLRGANLYGAYLREANLSEADLSEADLRGADLSGAYLREADLRRANLSGANLSGAKGLLNSADWLMDNFEHDVSGLIVYKRLGRNKTYCNAPEYWKIEPGAFLTEVANSDRCTECGSGVNFGTLKWCQVNYTQANLWKCRLCWADLAGTIVPYMTDGKARCERLELLEQIV